MFIFIFGRIAPAVGVVYFFASQCAAAQTTEYFDHSAFVEAADSLTVIDFDSLPGGTITGSEFAAQGLTIDNRDGAPINIVSNNTGSSYLRIYYPESVNSPPNALAASTSNAFNFNNNIGDNFDFIFAEPVSAAGLWVGNTGPGTNAVEFLDGDGAVIASETFDPAHEGMLVFGQFHGSTVVAWHNRIFYGIVSDTGIARIRTIEGTSDADGIVYDDVQFSEIGGGGDDATDCSADRASDDLCPGAPVADAGDDQAAVRRVIVELDGSGSSDPDEDYPLTFEWSLVSKPAGSAAALADGNTVSPSFTPDLTGNYVIELVVFDSNGIPSLPDQVIVSTTNVAPVADAGPDQAVTAVGSIVDLDGTGSFDDDGDDLEFGWSVVVRPNGSTAGLTDADTATPTFQPDLYGEYVIKLIVMDVLGASSTPDTVRVSFDNLPPVADAGEDQTVVVGQLVTLDGRSSTDPNGDDLSYSWSLVELPQGSAASLNDITSSTTSLTPDLAGDYVASLVVSDGWLDSAPSDLTVRVLSRADAASDALLEALSLINGLDPSLFKNPNMQRTMSKKINTVLDQIERGDLDAAAAKLKNDVLVRTDGCARGDSPDGNDWIIDCAAQEELYNELSEALALLS